MMVTVVGLGYVGLSLATLISRMHKVNAVDINDEKIKMINCRESPLCDVDIQYYFSEVNLDLTASTDISTCKDSDYIIISTPTNYNPDTNMFDTSSIEKVIEQISTVSADSTVIIKSTIPVGYTKMISVKYPSLKILFSPEFLREGHALHDNLHPSRIIVGIPSEDVCIKERGIQFVKLLKECALDEDIETIVTGSTEAESIKLFSNSYLAMRVSFFNELDSFAEKNNLLSKDIIKGVCLDPRIGNQYNNPSFGYGGYCLPKDTKQLLSNYKDVPNSIIGAIVQSNYVRKKFIISRIVDILGGDVTKTIGIYRITMKSESDNYRESSVVDIMHMLNKSGYETIIYEPTCNDRLYGSSKIVNNLSLFKCESNIIIANRMSNDLNDVIYKVYCRDIFNRD